MANEHTDSWFALMDLGDDTDQRARLWNGYLGWRLPASVTGDRNPDQDGQQIIVDPPDGGWPTLSYQEKETLDGCAKQFGGHPEFNSWYMDFAGHQFVTKVDLSGLILIYASFDGATFRDGVKLSDTTRFHARTRFRDARLEGDFFSQGTQFHARVWFSGAKLTHDATFVSTWFMGGA